MALSLSVPEPHDIPFIHSLSLGTAGEAVRDGTRFIIKSGPTRIGCGRISSQGTVAKLEAAMAADSADQEEAALGLLAERAFSRPRMTHISFDEDEPRDDDPAAEQTAVQRADAHPSEHLDQATWAKSQPVRLRDFDRHYAPGIARLCRAEGWQTYARTEVAEKGCAAPGVTTLVAVNELTGTVAGFAQVLSDGIAQGYLAQLIVHPAYRRIRLARTLVKKVFTMSGAQRLDLLTDDAQAFYETFEGHAKPGYRIYPHR